MNVYVKSVNCPCRIARVAVTNNKNVTTEEHEVDFDVIGGEILVRNKIHTRYNPLMVLNLIERKLKNDYYIRHANFIW